MAINKLIKMIISDKNKKNENKKIRWKNKNVFRYIF